MPKRKPASQQYKTSEHVETKSIKPVFYFLFLFITIFTVLAIRTGNSDTNNTSSGFTSTEAENNTISISDLSLAIRKRLSEEEGVYSVRFEDLNSKNSFGINDELIVPAASVIKIPVLAALYHLADQGEIDLEESITIPESDMQRWGTGIIKKEEADVSFTHRELAQIMMEHSDNTAVFVIANRVVGINRLQDLIESWELKNTNYLENEISNKDMNRLMRMMYFGQIVDNSRLNDEMIGWMDDSDFEERLPRHLPDHVSVYHKIGNEVAITHDVGIVDLESKPYYLGVLGTQIPDHNHATDVIADISRLVYEIQREIRQDE